MEGGRKDEGGRGVSGGRGVRGEEEGKGVERRTEGKEGEAGERIAARTNTFGTHCQKHAETEMHWKRNTETHSL